MSRRALGSLAAVALAAVMVALVVSGLDTAVRRLGLPLRLTHLGDRLLRC